VNNMECRGCSADLKKAVALPLSMKEGFLIITCSLCRYEHFGQTSKNGLIQLVKEIGSLAIERGLHKPKEV